MPDRTPDDIAPATVQPAAGPDVTGPQPVADPWDGYHKQFAQLWWPRRYSRATGPIVVTDNDHDSDGTPYLFQTNALGCVRVRYEDVDALAWLLHMSANALVKERNAITDEASTLIEPELAEYNRLVNRLRGYLDRPDVTEHVPTYLLADLDQIVTESEMDARTFGHEPGAVAGEGYTVIGVWLKDEPIPVGAVRGRHSVGGGEDAFDHFEEGVWAVYAEGDEATAQTAAVAEMRSTLAEDRDDDGDD